MSAPPLSYAIAAPEGENSPGAAPDTLGMHLAPRRCGELHPFTHARNRDVRTSQLQIREIKNILRRRWKLFLFPLLLAAIVGGVAAYTMPRKYESSTTILVRVDQTLNPVTGWDLSMALDDQMRNFNEIVRSRPFIQALIDSLGMGSADASEADRSALLAEVGGNISATRLGSDSFVLTYSDADPLRAQKAAQTLAHLFIQTKLRFELQRNLATVRYFEKKVAEYRAGLEISARTLVSAMKDNLDEGSPANRTAYFQAEDLDRASRRLGERIREHEDALAILTTLPGVFRANRGAMRAETGKQPLLELQRSEIPFAGDLRSLLTQYDDISRRYTGNYPDVQKLEDQIINLLERMRKSVESELYRMEAQLNDSERKRYEIIGGLQRSNVSQRMNVDKESNYEMTRKLYDDAMMKLEQARVQQEVTSQGANQFILLDPAYLPLYPSKPNRSLIVAGSLIAGGILGILAMALMELLDTTVRSPKDLDLYNKPIIALLPEGRPH